MIKNLFIIVALMTTLAANSQARLGRKSQEIYDEFRGDSLDIPTIGYKNDPDGVLYLLFYPDPNVCVQYFLDKDSVCTSMLLQTFTQEMTDFIIGNYTKKEYLKIDSGWLMRDNGIIFEILHIKKEDGINMFYWH
jgi:hypothetical protein